MTAIADHDAAPAVLWPTWSPGSDGYGALARYVSVSALMHTRLDDASFAMRESVSRQEGDRRLVADRFARLQRERLRYAHEPWLPPRAEGQQIRHPEWLLTSTSATCLDVATTFASMCLQAHVMPMIATDEEHAWVVLRLAAEEDEDWVHDRDGRVGIDGTSRESAGVWLIEDPARVREAVDDDVLLALDCVAITRPDAQYGDALDAGRARLDKEVRLIDVAWLQQHGNIDQLPRPTRRPGIRTFVPGGRGTFRVYPSRGDVLHELPTSGSVALLGTPGTGKSTIAREIAVDAPSGAGWFLDASSRQALIGSLSRAELAERDQVPDELTDQAREGYAFAALQRLREVNESWVVVLDNADGHPNDLRGLIPQPKAGSRQLVLLTTTSPAWEHADPPVEVKALRPLDDNDVTSELDERLAALVGGRPLLLESLRSLTAATGLDAGSLDALRADIPDHTPDSDIGAAVFWAALSTDASFGAPARRLCEIAALLPPDFQPVTLLERLSGARRGTAVDLARRGLFSWDGGDVVRLHRLYGRSIRRACSAEDLDDATLAIATDDDAIALLDRRGAAETTLLLSARLIDIDTPEHPPDRRLGTALHHMAGVRELKGDTTGSAALYERAERHFVFDTDEDLLMRADCLHGQARRINQQNAEDEPLVRAALEMGENAQQLLEAAGRPQLIGRTLALQGLMLQKTARFTRNREEKIDILNRARKILVDADGLRRKTLAPDDPERARSQFNLAGSEINLAKLQVDQAAGHLDEAEAIYTEVGEFRRRVYQRDIHPHIAACENGLAITHYYRAMLVPASAVQQTEWLRAATRHAESALSQREGFDGPEDLKDTQKSLALLIKIATARSSLPARAEPTYKPLRREMLSEHRGGGLVLSAVPPLTSQSDAAEHIAAWVRSDALAKLVTWFGGAAPQADRPLDETLAALDEFSTAWNFRAGKGERNEVTAPVFSGYDEMLVAAAAVALGLTDKSAPPLDRYDHLIVLGGLARASLARPLAAAELLDTGLEVGSVIALGSFRPVNAAEQHLLDRLAVPGAATELDIMDHGVRQAFATTTAPRTRAVADGPEHARWEVRSYLDATPPVHVVAAPAPSPERRANTAETCRWLVDDGTLLQRGQSVLIVTTHHYRPYQLADAIRELGRPLDLTIDAVGMSPGDVDYRLAFAPTTDAYLQEIRSTIRSYRKLLEATVEPS